MIPPMNQYLLTFRDKDGMMWQFKAAASSMVLAIHDNQHLSQLIKIERIDPDTGAVLGGRYYE